MKKLLLALIVGLAVLLTGCTKNAPEPATREPSVSTPGDESPSADPADDFDTAVKFTELVHDDSTLAEANELTLPESPAARYVAHQSLARKAEKLTGEVSLEETPVPVIDSNKAKKTVTVTFEAVEGEPERSYTWKDFTYESGKITGWTGKSGPINKVLWTRTSTDENSGVTAKLGSAYLANNGGLYVVVELASSRDSISFAGADYAASDGYRQETTYYTAPDIGKGEKTLGLFVFEDSKFGGTLYIPVYQEQANSDGDVLKLKVK